MADERFEIDLSFANPSINETWQQQEEKQQQQEETRKQTKMTRKPSKQILTKQNKKGLDGGLNKYKRDRKGVWRQRVVGRGRDG